MLSSSVEEEKRGVLFAACGRISKEGNHVRVEAATSGRIVVLTNCWR
jgi:hypothetical protein